MIRLSALVAMVIASTSAAPARPVSGPAPATHCHAGEAIIYSCRFGNDHGSVCATPGRIAYRFGPIGRPAIAIRSTPDWSNVRIGRVVGGGGGGQTHLRFTVAGHDYVVFHAIAGALTENPGRQWSGIHVQRGNRALGTRHCKLRLAAGASSLDQARDFAPMAARSTLDDTDPRFDAWF